MVKKIKPLTKLKRALIERDMTQCDLAEKAELEKYQVSKICSGKVGNNMMLSTAFKISKVLNMTVDELFGEDE